MDIVDQETRSRMMSGIRSKNTKPELVIRSLLHRDGFRFRIHRQKLPGTPDIVLVKYGAVIFVHGCFWHKHDCKYFKMPKTRTRFGENKLRVNCENDTRNREKLLSLGWRVCIIHECSIREAKSDMSPIMKNLEEWLHGEKAFLEISI